MRVYIFWLLFLGTEIYALWRGGSPERVAAGTFAFGLAATILAASSPSVRWSNIELGVFAADAAMLLVFFYLLLRANRLWPILMTALQAIQVSSHFVRGIDPNLNPFAYWLTSSLWGYLMMVVLIVGTAMHRRRLATRKIDPAWSSFWKSPV
jgi:hypothetical protein